MSEIDVIAPRRIAVRFPSGPGAPTGASFNAPNVMLGVLELIRRLGVDPDELSAQELLAHGPRLAIIVRNPERPSCSRIGAFVTEGVSELELNLALAWWRTPPARELRGEARA